ncbi:acetate kinase [Clavibacter michiganensis subsp. insidiosus]|uniref:Acetate kinase n=1 Tax=Clavibacter michiganensis subsp. insidiosus TaxID=33014 RepID=A0A0D5CF11_9MICO|nr:acetate kinase [Clavibacter michiganensis]AJW77842.1 acetate kinase [Clavibacter michiganensis subsp. insidiosus]AWG00053.1 acetate kinase [Clavibacter michiganensis subsp. insidiosus]OQJ58583.1 acetate kinase [Clavibacter michiganensis subsp. insidiosus]RII87335.1 acetate kinase [Clavibacter michiganensis subsp. insidiosus]RIJ44562.1 acetate kinase [Clavibacter michiganensis subsp. insidiosus]
MPSDPASAPAASVLVLNAGSSSLKHRLVDPVTGAARASGTVERIGEPGGDAPDHESAVRIALDRVQAAHLPPPLAVGHRVVHGGSLFDRAVVVDADVERAIDELSALAPLHNPANLAGIRAARAVLPDVPHVAVFDTAFHRTIPEAASTYAIDADLAARFGIRRYGFHGTSHQFVSRAAAAFLGKPLEETRMIVLHIGNGASACAIDGGRSIETSMGLTPLEGLVMGTRSGDIDPAVLFHLHRQAGLGFDELEALLNRGSGLLGLTGSSDMRDVQAAELDGDPRAALALEVYRHRIRRYVGAYMAELGGLDAVVFTAGVGEHDSLLRRRSLAGLEHLGIQVDPDRNELASTHARRISPEGSPVAVLVVPTDEEWEIARQAAEVI